MKKLLAIAAAILAVAGIAGTFEVAKADAACTVLCNQYVHGYYKPSTGTYVNGYWRNSPTDSYRATPYTPRSTWQPTTIFRPILPTLPTYSHTYYPSTYSTTYNYGSYSSTYYPSTYSTTYSYPW